MAQTSQGIPFLSKWAIICFIMALTLLYSIYKRNFVLELSSSGGPVLEKLPSFKVEEFQKESWVSSENLFDRGNPLAMIHFWATWCAPCELELPGLIKLAKKFGQKEMKVILLAVRDENKKIKKHLRRFGKLPENILIAHDKEGEVLPLLGTVKLPETYLFNRSGKHLRKFVGPQDWTLPGYESQIRFYLSIKKPYSIESH